MKYSDLAYRFQVISEQLHQLQMEGWVTDESPETELIVLTAPSGKELGVCFPAFKRYGFVDGKEVEPNAIAATARELAPPYRPAKYHCPRCGGRARPCGDWVSVSLDDPGNHETLTEWQCDTRHSPCEFEPFWV